MSGGQWAPTPPSCPSRRLCILARESNPCVLSAQDLQKLPWESMPSLRALSVTRLPSFRFLLSYSIIKEVGFRG